MWRARGQLAMSGDVREVASEEKECGVGGTSEGEWEALRCQSDEDVPLQAMTKEPDSGDPRVDERFC